MDLYAGIDIGTSGVRCCAIDGEENVVASAAVKMPAPKIVATRPCQDAEIWWRAVSNCLVSLGNELDSGSHRMQDIRVLSVDGTSGTLLLADDRLNPIAAALMYNSTAFNSEAEQIAAFAPAETIAQGPGSGLARLLHLQNLDHASRAKFALHQADWIAARLMNRGGLSDETNSLKTGYDVHARKWPDWVRNCGIREELLPRVTPVGTPLGTVDAEIASRFGFSPHAKIVAGTTDSNAAFLASGASKVGDGVTSLGTTLAIKLLSHVPVSDSKRGVYSHRIGDMWLPGGASNTGGGVLLRYFTVDRMQELETFLRPQEPTELDYYPLTGSGERFPIADPKFPPRLSPRPNDDAEFLQGMLEGISRIEQRGYSVLSELGAGQVQRIFTAGGGAKSSAWTEIRSRILRVPLAQASSLEASFGMARIAAGAVV